MIQNPVCGCATTHTSPTRQEKKVSFSTLPGAAAEMQLNFVICFRVRKFIFLMKHDSPSGTYRHRATLLAGFRESRSTISSRRYSSCICLQQQQQQPGSVTMRRSVGVFRRKRKHSPRFRKKIWCQPFDLRADLGTGRASCGRKSLHGNFS